MDLIKANEYRISLLDIERWDEFIKLNQKIYPNITNIRERFKRQILDNPFLRDKHKLPILIAYNTKDQMIGQYIGVPYEFYFNGQCIHGFNDEYFHVLPNYRGKGIGKSLSRAIIDHLKPAVAIQLTTIARKINSSVAKGQTIGYLHSFVWLKDFSCFVKVIKNSIFNNLKEITVQGIEFPKTITVNNDCFTLTTTLKEQIDCNWDKELFVFGRSKEFINWRFLVPSRNYYFYLLNSPKSQVYFVIKKSTWRGLNILEVIDYRIPYKDTSRFTLILSALKLLTNIIKFDGIRITSSNGFFDDILKKSSFIEVGKPQDILLHPDINIETYKEAIKKRDFVIATKADIMVMFS